MCGVCVFVCVVCLWCVYVVCMWCVCVCVRVCVCVCVLHTAPVQVLQYPLLDGLALLCHGHVDEGEVEAIAGEHPTVSGITLGPNLSTVP